MSGLAALPTENRRRLADVAVVGCSVVLGLAALFLDFEEALDGGVTALDVGLLVAGSASLLGRHRAPLVVAVAVLALRLVSILVNHSEFALVVPVFFAFYALARSAPRSIAYGLGVGAVVVSTAVIISVDRGESLPQEVLGESAAALLPVALGDAARSRDERLAAIIEAEASKRVQAERLRIARDLHDVVAHGLATIAVQSGTAAYNLEGDDPDDPVRVALERINATGKRSLEELRTMVGVLRSTDDAPIRPTPTDPDDLSDLTEAAAAAGVELAVRVDGRFPADTSEATIVASHRIAEEALTNVARHAGPVPATLTVTHGDEAVVLRITNAAAASVGPHAPAQSTGVGIVGMRERAESIGGSLQAGPTADGEFEVTAVLPYRQEAR